MKRNPLFIVLLISIVLTVCPVMVLATGGIIASGSCGDNLTWTLDDEGTLRINGTGMMENYSKAIPDYAYSEREDYNDDSGSTPWASFKNSIKTIIIGNGTESIGNGAFQNCKNLISVKMANSVTAIGEKAFGGCTSLKDIEIPKSVTEIGKFAFYTCTSLIKMDIPNSVTSIGNNAFRSCSGLTVLSVDCGGGYWDGIGDYAFSDCSNLTEVVMGDGVRIIGKGAFKNCSSLNSITMSNGLIFISDESFCGCPYLKSVTIPKDVYYIGYRAFDMCNNLNEIKVNSDNYYKFIGGVLFEEKDSSKTIKFCSKLKTGAYNIPEDVTAIEGCAFSRCTELTEVIIPDSVTEITSSCFYKCSNLQTVRLPETLCGIEAQAFLDCTNLKEIIIPDDGEGNGVKIGRGAFGGCSGLISATIPGDCAIEEGAFRDCINLTDIYYGGGTDRDWSSAGISTSVTIHYYSGLCGDNVTFNMQGKTLIIGGTGRMKDYTWGSAPWGHGDTSFASSINEVAIQNGVTKIGDRAFSEIAEVASIGSNRGKTNFTSISIPLSVTTIGDYAFSDCRYLTDVYYSGSYEEWNRISIGEGNECLTKVTVHYNSILDFSASLTASLAGTTLYYASENTPELCSVIIAAYQNGQMLSCQISSRDNGSIEIPKDSDTVGVFLVNADFVPIASSVHIHNT